MLFSFGVFATDVTSSAKQSGEVCNKAWYLYKSRKTSQTMRLVEREAAGSISFTRANFQNQNRNQSSYTKHFQRVLITTQELQQVDQSSLIIKSLEILPSQDMYVDLNLHGTCYHVRRADSLPWRIFHQEGLPVAHYGLWIITHYTALYMRNQVGWDNRQYWQFAIKIRWSSFDFLFIALPPLDGGEMWNK